MFISKSMTMKGKTGSKKGVDRRFRSGRKDKKVFKLIVNSEVK